jgi:hypothetical protein
MRGNGLINRPVRPQIRQHNHMPGRVSGQRGNNLARDSAGAFTGATGSVPQKDDAGHVIEREL